MSNLSFSLGLHAYQGDMSFLRSFADAAWETHHFSATMPFAVKPSIYSRPFPTRPKFADVATAMRESKKGEYLTL